MFGRPRAVGDGEVVPHDVQLRVARVWKQGLRGVRDDDLA
jgi:hypothetical protein